MVDRVGRCLRLGYSLPEAKLRGNYHPVSKGGRIHQAKLARDMRFDAGMLGALEGLECAFGKARITYHFYHSRKIDLVENLVVGMKSFLDGLVDANVFPSDDPDHVVPGEHTFTKCAKGESRVEISVEEIGCKCESGVCYRGDPLVCSSCPPDSPCRAAVGKMG